MFILSEQRDKESVIQHKKHAIRSLNNLFESYISSDTPESLKKVDLMSYWIETYSQYIENEKEYDPKRQISYSRGDIIKVNFGFNIGAEYGGLHYAIVIDNKNDHSSPVVTVLPLTSGSEEETYKTDIYLGNELHSKIYDKWLKLDTEVNNNLSETTSMKLSLQNAVDNMVLIVNHYKDPKYKEYDPAKIQSDLDDMQKQINIIATREQQYKRDLRKLNTLKKELDKMKSGSIVLLKQITTVSKQRIYSPRNSSDALYNISLSPVQMDKINQSLKELYLF